MNPCTTRLRYNHRNPVFYQLLSYTKYATIQYKVRYRPVQSTLPFSAKYATAQCKVDHTELIYAAVI